MGAHGLTARVGMLVGAAFVAGCWGSHGPGRRDDAGHEDGGQVDAGQVTHRLEDTLGWAVEWRCTPDYEDCSPLEAVDPTHPVDCGERREVSNWVFNDGVLHLIATCDGGRGWTVAPGLLRPARCETDADCEAAVKKLNSFFDEPYGPSACRSGICRFPERDLHRRDIVSLCLADEPRWPVFATRDEDSAVAEAEELAIAQCDTDGCSVPEACEP